MASVPYQYNVCYQRVHHRIIPQTCLVPVPPRHVQVELIISVEFFFRDPLRGNYTTSPINPFPSQKTLCFGLNTLHDLFLLNDVISPVFTRLGINIFSISYTNVLLEIMQRGLAIANEAYTGGYNCRVLYLTSEVQALLMNWETLMLEESELEFERTNYGMVAANESSIEEMLKRVRVEEGDEEKCVICLEQLKVGLEGSRMPSSHSFHGDCIERWLKQSHYCPICRFEMSTD